MLQQKKLQQKTPISYFISQDRILTVFVGKRILFEMQDVKTEKEAEKLIREVLAEREYVYEQSD